MAMIGGGEPLSTKKILLSIFILYIACNHIVRFAAAHPADSTKASPFDFTAGMGSTAIASVNGFRLRTGDIVSSVCRASPRSAEGQCLAITHGVKVVLGLH
jgi:hypothetical protein